GNAARIPGTENDPVMIVLKLDDVRTGANGGFNTARWSRVSSLMHERKIKYSLGLITKALSNDKSPLYTWLDEVKASGLAEVWFHGWDHGVREVEGVKYSEFSGRDYNDVKKRFDDSQALATAKLGAPLAVFGPPGGGQNTHIDTTALRVLAETPHMRGILYPVPLDDAGRALEAGGKITVLDRDWEINIEHPLFAPNLERLKRNFPTRSASRRYLVLQGHPAQWDDPRWDEFVRIIDYLSEQKIRFVTPSELIDTLTSAKSKN
ncbi:MAG TPA: DUF2334 domain-containing protein, partial [Rariglobus sp.]